MVFVVMISNVKNEKRFYTLLAIVTVSLSLVRAVFFPVDTEIVVAMVIVFVITVLMSFLYLKNKIFADIYLFIFFFVHDAIILISMIILKSFPMAIFILFVFYGMIVFRIACIFFSRLSQSRHNRSQ